MNRDAKKMTELLTAAQMCAMEKILIDGGQVAGHVLMERAGRGVVAAIFNTWPEMAPPGWEPEAWERGASPSRSPKSFEQKDGAVARCAVVFCGPGNNGGDGFVVARLLHGLGWDVDVFLYGEPASLPPDASANYKKWRAIGDVTVRSPSAPPLVDDSFDEKGTPDLVVDALLGGGLSRPLRGPFSMIGNDTVQRRMRDLGVRRVAIDVPSGLCADSGRVLGGTILPADLTVTFQTLRVGHIVGVGPDFCGSVVVVDIGVPVVSGAGVSTIEAPQDSLHKQTGHKFCHGHALVVTGGMAQTGAARLAARGALRIGAGLVTLAPPGAAIMECAAQVTAVMVKRCDDAAMLQDITEDARISALCLGPGLGLDRACALVPVALRSRRPIVIDADGLSAFEDDPAVLFADLHGGCVLTPHGGEFHRLFPDLSARLTDTPVRGPAFSKVDATRAAAGRAGCVVLFKGADTVIAAPDGRCAVGNAVRDRAAPWLATAGSGDVLAGFITGLMARGQDPFAAACAAVWLHVECARSFGPGLIAEDLSEQLPQVFRSLGD